MVFPAPAVGERNLLYLIFLPTSTTSFSQGPAAGVLEYGYHDHARFNTASTADDLFYSAMYTNPNVILNPNPPPTDLGPGSRTTSGFDFAKSLAYIVSHELNEAFTDRDFLGFNLDVSCSISTGPHTDNCEIGDICEQTGGATSCCSVFKYKGWSIEYYWSNWDNKCIQGDAPVSLKQFLHAIGVNGSIGLRRQLNTNRINVDYVADTVANFFGLGN